MALFTPRAALPLDASSHTAPSPPFLSNHPTPGARSRFVKELARVCAPGGRVIVVTWCHRVLAPGEAGLSPDERALLDRICEAYYLPAWCSVADYQKLFGAARARCLLGWRRGVWWQGEGADGE